MTIIIGIIVIVFGVLAGLFKKTDQETKSKKWLDIPSEVRRWRPVLKKWCKKYDVPLKIAHAVLWVENQGTMLPDGDAGEKGLMQIKEIAVRDLRLNGYEVPDDWDTSPESNIETGVKILHLFRTREPDWTETIKAYNQGNRGEDIYHERAMKYLAKVEKKMNQLPYE